MKYQIFFVNYSYRGQPFFNIMSNEIWRPVPEYEGIYEVSSLGRIKSLARKTNNQYGKKDMIMRPGWICNKNGYLFVYLSKNGCRTRYLVHRLVATVFIPNPYNLPLVNHKDCNPNNNHVENLEWCDAKYNINYGDRNKIVSKKLSIPVKQYTKDGRFVAEYTSAVEAGAITGIDSQNISRCRAGSLPSAGGYVWTY